jgi:hypothetical protein
MRPRKTRSWQRCAQTFRSSSASSEVRNVIRTGAAGSDLVVVGLAGLGEEEDDEEEGEEERKWRGFAIKSPKDLIMVLAVN